MSHSVRVIPLGTARISVINVGNILWSLSEAMNVPESEWRPHYAAVFERPLLFPCQCIHIALPEASVLVDANDYTVFVPPGSPSFPPNYQPPPSLIAQLLSQGVHAEDITHLVITHAHIDHYAGVTTEREGHYVPCFPNARCFLSRADWEGHFRRIRISSAPPFLAALRDLIISLFHRRGAVANRTLGVLHRLGLLELVEGNCDLLPAVRILAMPGETAGHQIVRVHSEGQTLYCLGDLYRHPVEVEHPTWMVRWANVAANLASRSTLMEAALAENALLIAAHIPTIGRLERTASGVRWVTEETGLSPGFTEL